MTTVAEPTTTTALTIWTDKLITLLGNVIPFASSPKLQLPILAAIRLEYENETLTAITTDRYCLVVDTLSLAADQAKDTVVGDFTFLLNVTDAIALVRTLKTHKGGVILLSVENNVLTAVHDGGVVKCYAVDGQFPKYRLLMPSEEDLTAGIVNAIAVNPQLMAKFGKVDSNEGRNTPMRMRFTSSTKPIDIRIGATFHGLIMLVRVAN